MPALPLMLLKSVMASAHALNALRSWSSLRGLTDQHQHLDAFLQSRLREAVRLETGNRHFRQVELAFLRLGIPTSPSATLRSSHCAETSADAIRSASPWFLKCLTQGARRLLCEDGDRVALRWDNLGDAQRVTRYLEPTQLSAAHLAAKVITGPRIGQPHLKHQVFLAWARDALIPPVANPLLSSLGRRGLVDVHRHMNVSLHPILIWGKLMESDRLPERLPEEAANWIRCARRLRTRLTQWLGQPTNTIGRGWLLFVLSGCSDALHDPIRPLNTAWCSPFGELPPSSAVFERLLLVSLFEALHAEADETAAAAVHAYCILQNLVYDKLVMSTAGSDGLDRFVEFFGSHALRDFVDHEGPARLVQAYRTGRVRWLEARMTPGRDVTARVYGLRDSVALRLDEVGGSRLDAAGGERPECILERQVPREDLSLPAIGLVIHLVKPQLGHPSYPGRGGDRISRADCSPYLPSHARRQFELRHDLGARNQQERYAQWQSVDAIVEVMAADPLVARIIVGFDVCGSEAATDVGTYAAHLRYLRACGRPRPWWPTRTLPEEWHDSRRLFITCHAGEDFEHLLGGLRHIDEALEFFRLISRDRIGHATALGIPPVHWMKRLGSTCFVRRGEWLDDLVWFHEWLLAIGESPHVQSQLVREIARLSNFIYQISYEPFVLWEAWRLRAEDPGEPFPDASSLSTSALRLDGEPLYGGRAFARQSLRGQVQRLRESSTFKVWRDYHCDPDVRHRSEEVIEVLLEEDWARAIEAVQNALTQKVINLGVILEVNPSSNLTLGPLDAMQDHPVFRWLDPQDMDRGRSPRVVVGSDDPSAFATELILEYAFLARAAEDRGATQRQIQGWLEYLRKSGVEFSFLPQESFTPCES